MSWIRSMKIVGIKIKIKIKIKNINEIGRAHV